MLGRESNIDNDALLEASEFGASNTIHRIPTKPVPTDISLYSEDAQNGDDKDGEDIVVGLFRAWLNEKATPELLPFPHDIIFGIRQLLESQVRSESNILSRIGSIFGVHQESHHGFRLYEQFVFIRN